MITTEMERIQRLETHNAMLRQALARMMGGAELVDMPEQLEKLRTEMLTHPPEDMGALFVDGGTMLNAIQTMLTTMPPSDSNPPGNPAECDMR